MLYAWFLFLLKMLNILKSNTLGINHNSSQTFFYHECISNKQFSAHVFGSVTAR
jgi:hypothetical protein